MKLKRFSFLLLLPIVIGILLVQSNIKDKSKSLAYGNSIPVKTQETNLITSTPTVYTVTPSIAIPTQITSKTDTQIIKATYGPPFGFIPEEFTVKSGVPVRLEVYATENGRGCMGSIMIPDLAPEIQGFTKGQTNIINFTATTPGKYPITCAMGIPHGFIIVE